MARSHAALISISRSSPDGTRRRRDRIFERASSPSAISRTASMSRPGQRSWGFTELSLYASRLSPHSRPHDLGYSRSHDKGTMVLMSESEEGGNYDSTRSSSAAPVSNRCSLRPVRRKSSGRARLASILVSAVVRVTGVRLVAALLFGASMRKLSLPSSQDTVWHRCWTVHLPVPTDREER